MIKRILHTFLITFFITSCNENVSREIIPDIYIDVEINVNNQEYLDLRVDGGYVTIDGGVRGMIIYHKNRNNYYVYEQNCPFKPSKSCAKVDVDASLLFIQCPCCSSQFDFNGSVLSGPSSLPLKQYATTLSGSYLRIRN